MKLFFTISLFAAIFQIAVAFPSPLKQAELTEDQVGEESFEANPELRGGYYEGDIIIDEEQLEELRSGLLDEDLRWPDKTLVYILRSTNWTAEELVKIQQGVDLISSKTCIKFRQITSTEGEPYFLNVWNKQGCNAQPGAFRIPEGTIMSLEGGDQGCFWNGGTVAHEFIHALGFFHEQSRTDRDDWVTINWENLKDKKYEINFEKKGANEVTDFGIKYDYGSVMHYGNDFFGKEVNGVAAETITPLFKPDDVIMGQRAGLSDSDFAKLNAMYKCP